MLRRAIFLATLQFSSAAFCQGHAKPGENIVPGRFVVVYRNGVIPEEAERSIVASGAHLVHRMDRFGMASIAAPAGEEAAAQALLAMQPGVVAVLHDRYVTGHALQFEMQHEVVFDPIVFPHGHPPSGTPHSPGGFPVPLPGGAQVDTYYDSPQGWAVRQAGGFGDNVPGGSATGPWNAARGAGIRIAVLDSGIDTTNPSVAPNLAVNVSEIDQTALPSVCDDGSPQDQQGHGTWTASLAAAAIGSGEVIGVAPQATLLNIKVLQRMPSSTGTTSTAQCEAGEAGGLLSWVLEGIDAAIAQHADVISMSLGTLVDVSSGEGAGWKTSFDQATYAASQAGAVLVAAVGNDGLDLATGTLIELPAQARSVLPVVASTNPACAENLAESAVCAPGPVTRPSYSNYGAGLNALAAPGGSFPEGSDTGVSGFVRGACSRGLPHTADGLPASGESFGCFGFGHQQYVQAMGTSASAPLVAGAAAILRAANPAWSSAQVVAALLESGRASASMMEPQLNLQAALAFQP